MPNFTPGFALPYPDALDAPCDFAEQWCDFSAAFQGVIDGFQSVIDRTEPAIPLTRLLVNTPTTTPSSDLVIFDTLSVDTAGWVDFDANPTEILIDRGGYFVVVADATVAAVAGGFGYSLQVVVTGASSLSFVDKHEEAVTAQAVGFCVAGLFIVTVPTTVSMRVIVDSAVDLALERATLSVFWHSDRAAP